LIFFVTEPESEGSYFKTYNNAVRNELNRRGISFYEVALTGPYLDKENMKRLSSINSRPNDVWLMAYAHNPVINYISSKLGRKFGHVHGLEASLFEPAFLQGYSLNEEIVFSLYDGLFVNSRWAWRLIAQSYPEFASKTFVSGFPFDPGWLSKYKNVPKKRRLIAFNQRFSLDKLHIIEVYLSELLVKRGYDVIHLCPESDLKRIASNREARVLFREAQKRGLKFIINNTKDEYYTKLAEAEVLITTTLADTLSVGTLEAAALGVIPILPDWGPFPEYLSPKNLYPPYNIKRVLNLVASPPKTAVRFDKYLPEKVIGTYLSFMEVH
jgi:hypothetical protein